MKTFEERYTAWIDGQLTGDALTPFDQHPARRAAAGDADAAENDKVNALQLRALLKEHLQAPALTNNEFFNHQMRERIDAEIDRAARRRESTAKPAWQFPAFAWPFARLAGAGVLCLFVAGALYYGLVPAHQPDPGQSVATTTVSPTRTTGSEIAGTHVPPAPQPQNPAVDRPQNTELALLTSPTPAPVDLNDDIQIHPVTPSNAGNNTSATPLHVGNASVLWVSGLPYLPTVSGTASPAPNATPAPAPSAAPSANP